MGLYFEYSNLDPFLHTALVFLAFRVGENDPEEKDWLKSIYMSLFDSFRTLAGMLLSSSLLSRLKEDILSLEFLKNHSIFNWKNNQRIFFQWNSQCSFPK